MDYAIITTGGKQYKVVAGQILEVENLNLDSGTTSFDKVLMTVSGDSIEIGKPFVSGAIVNAKIIENLRGTKIYVSKFKAKSRYRRVTGHRQSLTKIEITGISTGRKAVKSKA